MEKDREKIKRFILEELKKISSDVNYVIESDQNLMETGTVDSFSFLEMLMSLEKNLNVKINFAEMDPSEYTSINGLTSHFFQALTSKEAKN